VRTPSGLLIPGSARGLTIHVPRGYEDDRLENKPVPVGVCRVAVGDGQVCGKLFYAGEESAFERHVGRCAREHIAEIVQGSPRSRIPVLDPKTWDPEVEDHMRAVGRRMLEEGRMTVKPSERAGF
jgi:hypothetical protein